MPTESAAQRPASVTSSPAVKHRGRARKSTGATRRTVSAHIQYELLPAYTTTPRTTRPRRKNRSVEGEAATSKSSRNLSHPGERLQESNTVPRRNKLTAATNENHYYGGYNQPGYQDHHGNQQHEVTQGMTAYQLVGYRADSLPPQLRALSTAQGTTTPYSTPDEYNTFPKHYTHRNYNANHPPQQQGRVRPKSYHPDVRPKSYHPDTGSGLLRAGHYQPDISYPSEGAVPIKKDNTYQPNNLQQNYNPSIQNNLYTDVNDKLVPRSSTSCRSYPTEDTLQGRKQPYPSPTDGAYPYTGLHANTGYASPTSGGGPHASGSSHSSPHEAYTTFSTQSELSMPSPRAHSTPRRQGSQPLLSHPDLDRYISPQALYAHLSNTNLAGYPGQGKSPPPKPQPLEPYPMPEDIYTLPVRRSGTPGPIIRPDNQTPYNYTQDNSYEIPIKIPYSSPRGSSPPGASSPDGNNLHKISNSYGRPKTLERQRPRTSSSDNPKPYSLYGSLQQRSHGAEGSGSYRSPQAQYVHAGRLLDDPWVEETFNHWDPDGSIHRMHSSSFHWRIFPHYTDLVMIPYKGKDRSIIRIERLSQRNVNYKAAHYVAEGPFKGIVINKAASELRPVGRADLTLSFDVSMTDKKRKVNPEYKERRKVHFWFKPEADNTELGREYMRQLLRPEGFPRDYVSFIKKALVLTQRFPLIQRIDIVLVPQHGGFDEQDSGYVNGDAMTSPTHEDWLKTTDEERAARMRAQGLGADPQSASMSAGQQRHNRMEEEERKRREALERQKKEEEERRRREEQERKRREEEERRRREEEERRRKEEEEQSRRDKRERQRREEQERKRREEEERQWREEQMKAKREAEKKRREQEEHKWKRRQEEERLRREKEEEERLRKLREEEERKKTHVEKLSNIRLTNQPSEESQEEAIQNFITVMTPAVYDYQYLPEVPVSNKTSVSFRLKAKSNAHVALSSVYGDTERKTYEIVIGAHDNFKSIIRHGGEGPVMTEAVTLNVLDGDEFRPFWINWEHGQVVVGEGMQPGEDPFLVWNAPENRIHSVNCMAVSTAPGSEGQWEFIEYIYPRRPEDETKEAKRARFRTSLMWLAKKQKMLQVLEDAYPNSVNTPDLLRICNIGLHDMMTAVVILKELEKRGLITEVVKGVWIRSPSGAPGDAHVIKVVDNLPVLKGRDVPTIAIVTSLYCEKLAGDAMMDHKVSYVKYKTEGESHVYTVGRIGNHMCVSTKLSRVGGSRGATIAAGNSVTRLLGIFDKVDHVIFVGSGGAVPDYRDYQSHVRLADIVVSCPSAKKQPPPQSSASGGGSTEAPTYIHCEKVQQKQNGKCEYETRFYDCKDDTLQVCVSQMRSLSEGGSFGRLSPWEKFIEQGLTALNAEESNFSRPSLKKDKLYAWINDKSVQVEHPKPPKGQEGLYKEGQTHVRYGPIASGKYIARNEKLRYDFARKFGVMAYDTELDACLDAVTGSRKDSFIIIRGISDYQDGSKSKEWQPYASLVAAAYMKALVTAMPTSYRRSGYYR